MMRVEATSSHLPLTPHPFSQISRVVLLALRVLAAGIFLLAAVPLTALLLGSQIVTGSLPSVRKASLFAFTLLFCPVRMLLGSREGPAYTWRTLIVPRTPTTGAITVGAIPTNGDFALLQEMLTRGGEQGMVIDVTDPEERAITLIGKPVTQAEWKKVGIGYCNFILPDFRPIPLADIDQIVEKIHTAVQAGVNVYIHCKAGMGRSPTLVAAYLAKYAGWITGQAALDFIKSRRKINLSAAQAAQVDAYTERVSKSVK